jgi:acetyl-CoA carboxylase biotin carboxyl carrier protein
VSNFNLEEIQTLLELLKDNDVNEFKLERGGDKLWLRRGATEIHQVVNVAPQPQAPVQAPITYQAPSPTPEPRHLPEALAPKPEPVAPKGNYLEIKSPMVGTFYRRPAVDADPYVDTGDIVKKGDVLCIVEAMKLMNEIESEVSGKIVEVCLADGQMAEYGEVLFRIEPTTH